MTDERPQMWRPTYEIDELDVVLLHSPLNLMTQFAFFLKDRFSKEGHIFAYDDDENLSKLFIGVYYETTSQRENAKPQIIVSRGQNVWQQQSVGHDGPINPDFLVSEGRYGYGRGQCDMRIQVKAQLPHEAELLGDILQGSIHMSRRFLEKEFTLLDIGSATILSPVTRNNEDTELWSCGLSFRVEYEVRWYITHASRKVREVHLSQKTRDALDYIKTHIRRAESV